MAIKSAKKTGGMDAFAQELENQVPTAANLKQKKGDAETKALLVRIPVHLHTKLKLEAVQKGYSIREIVEDMINARYK